MLYSPYHVINPIIGLMIFPLANLICARFVKSLSYLSSAFMGFAIGLLSVFILDIYFFIGSSTTIIDLLSILFFNFMTTSILGFCYLNVISLGETARRIRITREIYNSQGGLTIDEIIKRYSSQEILERRMSRLIGSG